MTREAIPEEMHGISVGIAQPEPVFSAFPKFEKFCDLGLWVCGQSSVLWSIHVVNLCAVRNELCTGCPSCLSIGKRNGAVGAVHISIDLPLRPEAARFIQRTHLHIGTV